MIGDTWGKLTEQQKNDFVKEAEDDKKRYAKELKQLEKKGYFINKDGKDSRDLHKPKKAADKEDEEMEDLEAKAKEEFVSKPKKVISRYLSFATETWPKITKKNPELKLADGAKLVAEKWKKLTDAQRQAYDKHVEEDKKRYEKEMKEFEELGYFFNADGVKSTLLTKAGKVLEFEKGTVMPKGVKPAYFHFQSEQVTEIKKKLKPDERYDFGNNGREIASKWNAMSPKQKKKYEKMQDKDKKRYEDQVDEIRKNGYFLTKDGVKSTELPEKKKKVKKVQKAE